MVGTAMSQWLVSKEQLVQHPVRMLRCLTVEEWTRAFPWRDLRTSEEHAIFLCVQCGVSLVARVRDLPYIDCFGFQPICTTCIEMRHALTGDGPIYSGVL